jgi:hypothetical protein
VSERSEQAAEEVVRHLQGAARELIAAARAALDVAEETVEEPSSLLELVAVLADLGRSVISTPSRADESGDGSPPEPRVQHIRVS